MSLQSRLMMVLTALLCVLLTAVLLISYDKGVHEVEEFLDGQLALSNRLLDAQVQGMLSNGSIQADAAGEPPVLVEILERADRGEYEPELAFKVWDSAGRILLHSDNAAEMPRLAAAEDQEVSYAGRQWLISAHHSKTGSYVIQTAHPLETRDVVGLDVMWRVISPLLIGIPLLLVAVYFAIKKTFKPVFQLGKSINQRSVTDTEPIPLDDVIEELKPLIRSFNSLLARMNQSLKNEQQFTANAAHELRSPIAGIKVQAQVAALSSDGKVKNKSVQQILLGIQRCERLINQMLRLARLDPSQPDTIKRENVAVRQVVRDAIEVAANLVSERQQKVVVEGEHQESVAAVDRELLATALSNLIENASKYSPVGSDIRVWFTQSNNDVCFMVTDQGSGIPEQEIDRLMQRFARGDNIAGQTGAGLGLAIVERIVKLHGGRFELRPNEDVGMSASICIPLG